MHRQITAKTTTDVILEALNSAAEAHGNFEADVLHGEYDDEWPQWYASHMANWLRAQNFVLAQPTS